MLELSIDSKVYGVKYLATYYCIDNKETNEQISENEASQQSHSTAELERKEKSSTGNEAQSTTSDGESHLHPKLIPFTFDERNFKSKRDVPIYCRECSEDGHIPRNCPFTNTKLEKLPEMTEDFRYLLDEVCNNVMKKLELKPQEFDVRMDILKNTEDFLKQRYKSKDLCKKKR